MVICFPKPPLEPEQQYRVALMIIEKQLNVRSTEELANSFKSQNNQPQDIKTNYHEKCVDWTRELATKFSTKVSVKLNPQGKGTVTIHVNSIDEIERLIGQHKSE